ncbi:hypothetical protein OSB04_027468 [Centaurea solstitialis]|uniref:Isopenicillin N synthase-like Fe(2+) 2OG dioxygenase domain-containing protein n=1 Tax=Centaurea solstitialis TaxID=347529 RepID=A0AA38VZR4_9ASTR|nr:hypothetical protein OSB04_027468 [Centaurea solstitialis]
MTILHDDDNVDGLEVMDKSDHFILVDPWPGTLVKLGDIARVRSNGRFCNVKHRVQCMEATIRISIASFLLGPRGVIKQLPELFGQIQDDENVGGLEVTSGHIIPVDPWPDNLVVNVGNKATFRINKYHFTPGSVCLGGAQLYIDTRFLTVLQDDESVGGLQVIDKSDDTIPVDPWPGTLVVNLGDMATAGEALKLLERSRFETDASSPSSRDLSKSLRASPTCICGHPQPAGLFKGGSHVGTGIVSIHKFW